jgi:hypothetical protein
MNPLNSEMLDRICKFGTYYNPANKHYNNGQHVVCDRCYRKNLDICIGYEKYDLCFNCVQDVIRTNKLAMNHSICPSVIPLDRPQFLTRMLPSQFNTTLPNRSPISYMLQNQFNN